MVKIYDREKKEYYIEEQYGEEKLNFLYHTIIGRLLLKIFIVNKSYSRLNAKFENRKSSIKKIEPFIKKYKIEMQDYEEKEYTSFNDFFTRSLKNGKRKIDLNRESLIAPADSKLLVYDITEEARIKIKDSIYSVEELLQNKKLSEKYKNGICLVYRLSVDDYHRYCYIDNGKNIDKMNIDGKLHTVSSISNQYKIYKENQREYHVQLTENMGEIIYMEVGALQVGKIINAPIIDFQKGQEKGYFEYGGSTIVILIQENRVEMDHDILEMSQKNMETKVKYGEKVGTIKC